MTQLRNISLAKHRKMWDSHWTLNHCLINHMQYFPSFELKLPSFRRTSSVDDQLIFFYHQSFLLAEHNQPASSIKVINPYNLTVLASDEVKLVKEFGCSTEDMLSSECSKLACFKMDLRLLLDENTLWLNQIDPANWYCKAIWVTYGQGHQTDASPGK